ncbi:MAG: sugar phosphate isomerase/epimerase [Phycisphaeraceae bacterium]
MLTRRQFCVTSAALAASAGSVSFLRAVKDEPFKLNYMLASAMYGKLPIAEVVAQVPKTGAAYIDLWRAPHADQREQVGKMGVDAFAALLKKHEVKLGAATIWGQPFAEELRFVHKLGGKMVVTGFVPKSEPKPFIEKLKPQLAVAEELNMTVAIENHGADFAAIRAFAQVAPPQVAIALAPYHLPQDAKAIGKLIEDIAPKLGLFYAWQHGKGAMTRQPKEDELLQLPGRGELDFGPMVAALKKAKYMGFTEIFMHPFPRGIPILDTAEAVTEEINRARTYLAKAEVNASH